MVLLNNGGAVKRLVQASFNKKSIATERTNVSQVIYTGVIEYKKIHRDDSGTVHILYRINVYNYHVAYIKVR